MKKLAQLNINVQEGLAAAQRVFGLLDMAPDVTDRPGARALGAARGAIRLEDVHFGYGSDRAALNGLTLDIPAGGTVALVGPSGAGKSTVLNLIPRFYDVDSGRVLIDGADVRDVTLASLRANIALVSQDIGRFDDTVRANTAYGRAGAGATGNPPRGRGAQPGCGWGRLRPRHWEAGTLGVGTRGDLHWARAPLALLFPEPRVPAAVWCGCAIRCRGRYVR